MFYNTNVYSVFKSRRKSRQSSATKLSYSDLEARKLLAVDAFATGSVTLDPTTSVLSIQGTNDVDDQLFISTQVEDEVRVSFNGDFGIFARSAIASIRFTGLGGDDVLNSGLSDISIVAIGGEGNDRLIGSTNVDRLVGSDGDDLLIGNQGADVLVGNDGADTLQGSGGNDVLNGGTGVDSIRGGIGNDTLRGDFGDDFLSGDEGDDLLVGGSGDDQLQGADGDDTIIGSAGDDTIIGGEGNDRLFGNNGVDTIFGQAGNDTINGNADDDVLSGGIGEDLVNGSIGNDSIAGDAGDDTLIGAAGNDTILGNAGDDFIVGGDGEDTIQGNAGADLIGGQAGDDDINGGSGEDTVFGGDGNDRILGGSQNDNLFGQAGSDTILGDAGFDRVAGNEGSDFLSGGFGNDLVLGNAGNDRLFGDQGVDELRGGDGNDGLFGGIGQNNVLIGDGGADRYITTGNEEILDAGFRDVEVIFRNGSSDWTNAEITAIDTGLHRLSLRTGNNRLSIDPIVSDPIVFLKEATIPANSPSLALTTLEETITPTINFDTGDVVNATTLERQYVFAEWNENDIAATNLRTLEVPRAIAISWASTDAIETVLPDSNQIFNRFMNLSFWQTTDGGDFFRASEDGQFFYREDASFADDTGRINPTQDWAAAWELFFAPVVEVETPDVPEVPEDPEDPGTFVPSTPLEVLVGEPVEFITGDSIPITSFLNSGFTQALNNFGFTLDAPGNVNIFTGTPGNGIQDTFFDTQIFLFGLNDDGTLGAQFATDDDAGEGFDSIININLPAGDYVLVLGDFPLDQFEARSGFGNGSLGGTFDITFEGTDGVVQLPNGPLNPGDGPGFPNPLVPIAPPENPGPDTGLIAKLSILDTLFSGLENF